MRAQLDGHVVSDVAQRRPERIGVSHEATRHRERIMRRFKSPTQAQRSLSLHGLVQNLFREGRLLLRAADYRLLRSRSMATWHAEAQA